MTRRFARTGILFFVLTALPWQAYSEVSAGMYPAGLQWLTGMRKASANLNYQGVVAYIKDQQVDSFKLYHQAVDGHERERLVSMNSPFREVVRVDGNVARYSADGQQVVVETRPAANSVLIDLPEDPTVLDRFYQVNLRGQEYVAGMLTQVIALEPRDGYRYSRLIWVDTQSKLPLKLDVLNEDGQSVEQMVFTTINTQDPIAREDLEPSSRARTAISQISHRESLPLRSLNWTLRRVPDGFQIIAYSVLKRPPAGQQVEHILLSDGFSSVSVYIEKKDGAVKSGTHRLGAVSVDTVSLNGFSVTVMGEVPLKTVEMIASGLEQKQLPH